MKFIWEKDNKFVSHISLRTSYSRLAEGILALTVGPLDHAINLYRNPLCETRECYLLDGTFLKKKRIAPLCLKFCDTVLNIKIGTKRPAFFHYKNFKLGSLGVAKGVGIRASAMVPRDLSGKPARKDEQSYIQHDGSY